MSPSLRRAARTVLVVSLLSTPAAPRAGRPKEIMILFRHEAVDADYGRLAVVSTGDLRRRRFAAGLSCETVAYAAGRGVCLTAVRGAPGAYAAVLFDASFRSLAAVPLEGVPSRCRVAPDGRTAAVTTFVSGHAYSAPHFSTRTLLLDVAGGKALADLEDFAVTRDGRPFKAADFNFWGVTFAPDSRHFYCTLNTNGVSYLLKGDVAARAATVLRPDVECPSVSPDGARIAYKRPVPGRRVSWRLEVLDVASMKAFPLAEKRSVDDQLQWLDDRNVLYSVSENPGGSSASTDVWLARVDGKTPPRLFLAKAYSPAVVR